MATATTFAQYYLWKPGKPLVGMSVRELSRECGFTFKTASVRLRDFQQAGLLVARRRATGRKGAEYELVAPSGDSQIGNTQPPPLGGVLPEGELFPTLDPQDLLRAELLSGAAFIRLGEGPVFTPTCADVLIALLNGPLTRAGIARTAGRSWGAVDRAVLILHSAGIVDLDPRSGEVRLLTQELAAASDDWATAMGVIIRPEIRQLMYEKEREEYRARLEAASDPASGGQ